MKKISVLLLTGILSVTLQSNLCFSDEVTDTLDQAKQAYNDKNYLKAIEFLNQGLTQIQKLVSQQVIECLPGTMDGWQRTEPASNLGSEATFGLISSNAYSVEVNYKKEPSQKVTVSILNIPHMVQIAKAGMQLLSNPFFSKMQQEGQPQEKMEAYKLGDFEGAQVMNTTQKETQIMLFYGDLMLQVKSSGVEDFQEVEKFAKAVKLEDLKKFSGNLK